MLESSLSSQMFTDYSEMMFCIGTSYLQSFSMPCAFINVTKEAGALYVYSGIIYPYLDVKLEWPQDVRS